MRIVQRNLKYGWFSMDGEGVNGAKVEFLVARGVYQMAPGEYPPNATGAVNGKQSWFFDTSTLKVVNSKANSKWPDNLLTDENKATWNVMEDGTMVTCGADGPLTSFKYGDRSGSEEVYGTKTSTFSKDGRQYELRIMSCGYRRKSVDYTMEDGVDDDYSKYILGSDDPSSSAWGAVRTHGADRDDYPASSTTRVYKISRGDSSGNMQHLDADSTTPFAVRAVAEPIVHNPYVEGLPDSLGNVGEGFSFQVTPVWQDGQTVDSFVAKLGDVTILDSSNVQVGVPLTVSISDDLFSSLSSGVNKIELTVSNGTGYENAYEVSFNKARVFVSLESNPATTESKPSSCTIASAVSIGVGATQQWWVCNNANDANPAWEEYTGERHRFSNDSKTADSWAVAWKCKIGGAQATTQSELIKQVAMGVSYEAV